MRRPGSKVAALYGAALLLGSVVVVQAVGASGAAAADPNPTPQTIPALRHWSGGTGSFTVGPDTAIVRRSTDASALTATSGTFAEDVTALTGMNLPQKTADSPSSGEIFLSLGETDPSLGSDGYVVDITDGVTITAATDEGVWNGTRTLLQMLKSGRSLPQGEVQDSPTYPVRAFGVCSCYTFNTMQFYNGLIKNLSYLKYNELQIEFKLAPPAPGAWDNTFSYYTPAEINAIVALATKYHIQVVPLVNSPSHIDPFISSLPDLQLKNASGVADPSRLDISNPEALSFYKSIVDAYAATFHSTSWAMGGDEYLSNSQYANYPQLLAYARDKFGPTAVAQDTFIDFMNQIDSYVKSKGMTLRVWNDGLTGVNTVPLNTDIVVENWIRTAVSPQNILDTGAGEINASSALYYIRGGSKPNAQNLYQSNWDPTRFASQTVAAGQPNLLGAMQMLWPDSYGADTENQVSTGIVGSMNVVAQANWGSPKLTPSYPTFQTIISSIGQAPGVTAPYVPVLPAGRYVVKTPNGGLVAPATATGQLTESGAADTTASTWNLTLTSDNYYQLRAPNGLCAAMASTPASPPNIHGVVEQLGAPVTAQNCSANATNQRWQLERVPGGYIVVNASTQEAMSTAGSGGGVVQQPRSTGLADTFTIAKETELRYTGAHGNLLNGSTVTLSATLTEVDQTPVAGHDVSFALGTQSCTGTTDSTGSASCVLTLAQPLGPAVATATFAGDDFYLASSDTVDALLYAFPSEGAFVVGDESASGEVTFWGAQWAKQNVLSSGQADNAFKGFASTVSGTACGDSWSSPAGNSSEPPTTVPDYMAVLVTATAAQTGPTISGTTTHVVIVKTDPGYLPDPSHTGTGTVVAVIC